MRILELWNLVEPSSARQFFNKRFNLLELVIEALLISLASCSHRHLSNSCCALSAKHHIMLCLTHVKHCGNGMFRTYMVSYCVPHYSKERVCGVMYIILLMIKMISYNLLVTELRQLLCIDQSSWGKGFKNERKICRRMNII